MAPFAECLECRRIGPLVADLPAQVANLQGDCEALRAEANAAKVEGAPVKILLVALDECSAPPSRYGYELELLRRSACGGQPFGAATW